MISVENWIKSFIEQLKTEKLNDESYFNVTFSSFGGNFINVKEDGQIFGCDDILLWHVLSSNSTLVIYNSYKEYLHGLQDSYSSSSTLEEAVFMEYFLINLLDCFFPILITLLNSGKLSKYSHS